MPLTAEQIKLMEENRRKALEKRAAAKKAEANQVMNKNQSNVFVGKAAVSPSSPFNPSEVKNNTSTSSFYSKSQSSTGGKSTSGTPASVSKLPPKNPKYNPSANSTRPIASFQLVSRLKFCVEAPFDNEMIEIFKKFPSKSYDPVTRKWTFSLADHQKMLESLGPLLTRYQLQPLPKFILDIFKNLPPERNIPEVDISCIDPKLYQALLPFQRQSVYFGIHLQGRILIADDMGLGKTLQALALAHYYLSDWPLLILTPSSMKFAWDEAVKIWLPSVPLHHIQVICSGKDFIDKEVSVTICSYDLLTRRLKDLESMNFKTIIFDESHLTKTRNSKRATAASSISAQAKRVILLSGTPALSRPEELFSQLQILERKPFTGTFHAFGLRYCGAKETNFGWNYSGATNMPELQLILEEKFMIRRLKSQVLSQLPPKQRQMIILDPGSVKCDTSAMNSLAKNMTNEFARAMEKRGALLSYYSETAKAKSKAVCDYIVDLLENGKKFLCFAHHQVLLNDISHCIEQQSKEYIRIDGSVSSDERKKLCDNFQLKDSVRVAVLSITAANTGLTLTSANLVVFAELFWNPGILTQAEDRAHRIGQQDSVLVQYLVAKGTADDYLWPLVQSKLDILSKAGLSKDNFHDADTRHLSNTKSSPSIIDFLEELSQEDLSAVDDAEKQNGSFGEPESKRSKTY